MDKQWIILGIGLMAVGAFLVVWGCIKLLIWQSERRSCQHRLAIRLGAYGRQLREISVRNQGRSGPGPIYVKAPDYLDRRRAKTERQLKRWRRQAFLMLILIRRLP